MFVSHEFCMILWYELENPEECRRKIPRRVWIIAPMQKETPQKTAVKSWISGVQYFSNFDHGM